MRKTKLLGVGILIIMTALAAALQASAATQELSYDSFNNATNISYDGLNRILEKNFSTGQHNYTYDADYYGTLTNVTFRNGSISYKYDDRLRVVEEARVIDGIRFSKLLDYDSANRLVKQDSKPGSEISYAYSQQGLINRIAGFINATRHNAFGNVLNRTYSSGKITNFTYDGDNARLTRINTDNIQNMIYDYDNVGNIIMINDSANDRLLRMGYDYLDRLLNMSINRAKSFTYKYDPIGNLLKIIRQGSNATTLTYSKKPAHAPSRITTGDTSIDIHSPELINTSSKNKVIGFVLVNERNATVNNANWSADFGDKTNITSVLSFNLLQNETAFVFAEHNYSSGGGYAINITTGDLGSLSDLQIIEAKFGISIDNVTFQSKNITSVSYEFIIRNDLNENTTDATWTCNNGLSSGSQITINATSTRTISLSFNYSSAGTKNLSCTVNSGNGNDTKGTTFDIKGIEIEAYNRTAIDGNTTKITFNITNHFYPRAVDYRITTDGQAFTGTTTVIGTEASAVISQEINYTGSGEKAIEINITATSNLTHSLTDKFKLKDIEIEDYYIFNTSITGRIFDFWIKNHWPAILSANWNITDPKINGTPVELNSSEQMRVFIETDYTTQGVKMPTVKAYSGSTTSSLLERFAARLVEILSYQTVFESVGSTVTEAFVQSNKQARNISWTFNTGGQTIGSNNAASVDSNESIAIIIESSYTENKAYNSSLYLNSSSINESAKGVVVT